MNGRALPALAMLLAAVLFHESSAQKRPSPQTGDNRMIVLHRVRTLARYVSDLRAAVEEETQDKSAKARRDGTVREMKSVLISLKSEVKNTGMDDRTTTDFVAEVTATQRALAAFGRARDAAAQARALDDIARGVERMGGLIAGPG